MLPSMSVGHADARTREVNGWCTVRDAPTTALLFLLPYWAVRLYSGAAMLIRLLGEQGDARLQIGDRDEAIAGE